MKEEVLPFKILGLDHVAVAVKDIFKWKVMYLSMGARVFYETSDASPQGASSMKLCGVKLGEYSIALIEGINREEISQVSAYVEKHGDHSFQHIAVAVDNIYAFVEWASENHFHFLGPVQDRKDAFGDVKQVFARKFDKDLPPDEAPFYEFVERPNQAGKFISADSFSDDFAKEFFLQIEGAQKKCEDTIFYNIEQSLLGA
jgi:hypothetical protein